MIKILKIQSLYDQKNITNIIVATLIVGVTVSVLGLFLYKIQGAGADSDSKKEFGSGPATLEKNSLLPISPTPGGEIEVTRRIRMTITAYSSSVDETDSTPYITASGNWVRDGIVANNLLPFGTKIRIPELYGEKIFVVEDRMHSKKGYYHTDIWFPTKWDALKFGTTTTNIEVLREI